VQSKIKLTLLFILTIFILIIFKRL
jgi:hypothetical protein